MTFLRRFGFLALVTCVCTAAPGLLAAQAGTTAAHPGPWIPVGSRLDARVTWLIAEGALAGVDPLSRPYRLAAARTAVAAQDTTALSRAGRRALRWLIAELAAAADSVVVLGELGGAAYSNGRRDTFREGGRSGGGIMGGIWAGLTRGPMVAVLNPAFENRLLDDPEYTGKTDRFIAGRLQAGYLAFTGALGDVGFGRAARQWGPALFDGLQLSPSAYATDQLWASVRFGRCELTTIAQRLDDQPGDSANGTPVNRFFLAHRLVVNAGRRVWLAFTETGVYGGPGRGLEPAFLAPLNPALLSEFNEPRQVNLVWGVEAHARLAPRLVLQGQFVIDDIQVGDRSLMGQRPWSGGFTVVGTAALAAAPVHLSLGYTRVRSLTYRNSFAAYEVYAVDGVGIARNYADYDETLFRLTAHPAPSTSIGLDLLYLRQGSGDFRSPFPSDSVLAQPGQGFLVPPVYHVPGARVTVSALIRPGLDARAELGVTRTAGGATKWIGGIAGRLRFDALHRRLGAPDAFPGVEPAVDRGTP